MKNILATITLSFILLSFSCKPADPNKQIDEGKIENETYSSQEIGWTIDIPKGWDIMTKNKIEENNQKGLDIIEESLDQEIDASGLKYLLSIQKNQFNIFQSTSQKFELEYDGEWEETNIALKQFLYTTFQEQGIGVDSTETTYETIDGLEFMTYGFTIYGPDKSVILKQIMYSRFINGYDFGVNINYNNEKDKKEMMDAWKNSKFTKR